jgi:methanogenic corrinoid protein MtbC1
MRIAVEKVVRNDFAQLGQPLLVGQVLGEQGVELVDLGVDLINQFRPEITDKTSFCK